MSIRPLLSGGAALLALQLLAVHAAPAVPVDPPKGWSVSDSIGKQYLLGFDSTEKAYFIENAGPIRPAGQPVNAETSLREDGPHVPYSTTGLKETDRWTAALLQSVEAAPYRRRKVHVEAEIKASGFKGQVYLMVRGGFPDGSTTTMTSAASYPDWQVVVAEIDDIPDFSPRTPDDVALTFGLLTQGEGRVLIRNVKLTSLDREPKPSQETPVQDMFGDPPATRQPVNPEMRR